jgi:hypothetical protein
MKISHEIPKQLFPVHDLINDYPYVLAHLLSDKYEYDQEYADFYRKKLQKSEFSILDNSAYELGQSIALDELHRLGEEYKPSHLVLPDVYGDYSKTMKLTSDYCMKYGEISTPKFFAVVQGQTWEEYQLCLLDYLDNSYIDVIALTFRVLKDGTTREVFLKEMLQRFRTRFQSKKIHFLGCGSVNEFIELHPSLKAEIYSVDTSAPIIHGWTGNEFTKDGFVGEKPKDKLAECLDIKLDNYQLDIIYTNVAHFKNYVK